MKTKRNKETPQWLSVAQDVYSGLKKEGRITFSLSVEEVTQIVQKVAEDLIAQEGKNIPGLKFVIPEPLVVINNDSLNVVCKTEIIHPVKVDLTFKYSYHNSKIDKGKLDLKDLRISMNIKSRFKRPVRKLIKKINIGRKAKYILSDINKILLDLFPTQANTNGFKLSSINIYIDKSVVHAEVSSKK